MDDCKVWLDLEKGSRLPKEEGDQFTLAVVPPLKQNCAFIVAIDGHEVKVGDRHEDFKVVGFGAAGTATFEARRDKPYRSLEHHR